MTTTAKRYRDEGKPYKDGGPMFINVYGPGRYGIPQHFSEGSHHASRINAYTRGNPALYRLIVRKKMTERPYPLNPHGGIPEDPFLVTKVNPAWIQVPYEDIETYMDGHDASPILAHVLELQDKRKIAVLRKSVVRRVVYVETK